MLTDVVQPEKYQVQGRTARGLSVYGPTELFVRGDLTISDCDDLRPQYHHQFQKACGGNGNYLK